MYGNIEKIPQSLFRAQLDFNVGYEIADTESDSDIVSKYSLYLFQLLSNENKAKVATLLLQCFVQCVTLCGYMV